MRPLPSLRGIACVLGSLLAANTWANDWRPRFEYALGECQAIHASDYETGLIFNPPGKHTYYKRSRCLQELAAEWRNPALCEQVRERRSLFFNGKAYSELACRDGVTEQMGRDRAAAATLDPDSFHKLEAVHFDQPHYVGDNIRQQVKTRGSHPGSYQLRIELWPNDAGEPVIIADYSQPLGGDGHSLTGTIPNQRLREVFGGSIPDHEIRARITLALPPRSHRDQFVLTQIPEAARRSQIETTFTWQQSKPQIRNPEVGD
ncbi:MAG: hypothetical protein ACNA7J_06515 [Wenzhouxiangella sp.]